MQTPQNRFGVVALIFSAAFLLITLGNSAGIREWFVRRVAYLAKDVADWVLFPLAILSNGAKLLLGSLVYLK